ncbi:LysE family translocator [Aestuariispira insulae]|uniref:Threonine/homoserine/homoserine lactone efflux protein n=1 Tax=Aestuariispira insulae TaxID=1461337 RepID=A0A3D9HWY1_9PROT|nr:LysE family translocator [Aestuariispira insulae]RED53919.1 threonine/homoserine/homoserine lactone efflux protein [Aestuariispira insulae]
MPVLFPIEALIPASLFALMMISTPGPTNMILLTMGAHFGVRRSMQFIIGVNCGFLVVLSLVGLGIGALFAVMPGMRMVFILLSGVYLLYLAWKIARSKPPQTDNSAQLDQGQAGFFKGVLTHVFNPKTWATVTTAMTQFTDPELSPLMVQSMILGAIFVSIGIPVNMVWTWAGDRIIGAIQQERTRIMVNGTLALMTVAIVLYVMIGQFLGH